MLKQILALNPGAFLAARSAYRRLRDLNEREMDLLPLLVPRDRLAVDVGAHHGVYTQALCGLAPEVVALEANPRMAAELRRLFGSRARIVAAAASDSAGEATLRIPAVGTGYASIDAGNAGSRAEAETVVVETTTLDALGLSNVGFIKIDIEGHECAALRGAMATLRGSWPNLLIESEERHHPGAIQELRGILEPLGYEGYMLWNGAVTSIRRFRPELHQDVSVLIDNRTARTYANNFIFLPTVRGG